MLTHPLHRDLGDFTKLVGGVNAHRLMPNPVLDGTQQRQGQPVGKERMLLVGIHGCPRNGGEADRVAVYQNARANGNALVADIRPRVIAGTRNKLRTEFCDLRQNEQQRPLGCVSVASL